jgi:hypothetical protein
MCIRVQITDSVVALVPWDPIHKVVSVPAGLPQAATLRVLRAILSELAVPQPPVGARCFCGAPVRLLPRVPQQRTEGQVTHHGA